MDPKDQYLGKPPYKVSIGNIDMGNLYIWGIYFMGVEYIYGELCCKLIRGLGTDNLSKYRMWHSSIHACKGQPRDRNIFGTNRKLKGFRSMLGELPGRT
jgi:hypothetical protein